MYIVTEIAVLDTDITFITVGMPNKPDGSIDLRYIKSSVREIGSVLSRRDTYHLVMVKSTVILGTTENVVKPILEKSSGKSCESISGYALTRSSYARDQRYMTLSTQIA